MRPPVIQSIIFLALAALSTAVTKRTALVNIHNNTPDPLISVSLLHKYSNNYKNQHQWAIIHPAQNGIDTLHVEYNTGFLTTGTDWWLVTWYSPDLKTQYYSNPNNFRAIVDAFEAISPPVIQAAAGAAAALTTSGSGVGAVAAAAAAVALAEQTTSRLFNSESTDGFKQYTLRAKDESALTLVTINGDSTITFHSKSGDATTVYSSRMVV